ncbi:MAG TPA: cysteine hydrolase [Terriglobia bacterium]|nr:cysteine hydrolase [Terriglobia bacterium]
MLEEGRVAHLCIDMQNLVAEAGPWETPWSQRILPAVVALCERYSDRTIFTRFVPPPRTEDAPGRWQAFYRKWPQVAGENVGGGMLDLMPPLSSFVPPAVVLDKTTYSAFSNPQLVAQLRQWQVGSLIISGIETDVCVLATALSAVDFGFGVVIPLDAICSSADIGHDSIIAIFKTRFSQQIKAVSCSNLL